MSETPEKIELPFKQEIRSFLQKDVLSSAQFDEALQILRNAREALRKKGSQGYLQMLESAFWQKDLQDILSTGKNYRRFHSVLIIGMGNSVVAGKAISSLYQSWVMSDSSFPFLYFVDNLDPEIFWELMSVLNPRTTSVLVISESGETSETLLLLMRCLEYWQEFLSPQELGSHFTSITRYGSTLSRIARQFNFAQFEYPAPINGRFSFFTMVGLLPAFIVGADPRKVRLGGIRTLKHFFQEETPPALEGAALIYSLLTHKKIRNQVLLSYGDSFQTFLSWVRHAYSESLGKGGEGFNTLTSLGPGDHHNQLQLYLNGPRDKLFTIFTEKHLPREKPKRDVWKNFQEIHFLAGASLEMLVHAQQEAMVHVLKENHIPLRTITVGTLSEMALGSLFTHFTLEILLLAEVLKVDPLTQPITDGFKSLAKRFLSKPNVLTKAAPQEEPQKSSAREILKEANTRPPSPSLTPRSGRPIPNLAYSEHK
jgi:glucose-6-phosphate isomerase